MEQMREDGRIRGDMVGAVTPVDEDGEGILENEWIGEVWDDISGQRLDPQLVRQARREELAEIRKHKVYKKVPWAQCVERTGKPPIGVRWVRYQQRRRRESRLQVKTGSYGFLKQKHG